MQVADIQRIAKIEACFHVGTISSDAGMQLVREAVKRMRLCKTVSRQLPDERDITSMYVEFSISVFEDLEFQVVARYESYSDEGFESDIRPKLAFKYKPLDWFLFRASYSESFKARDFWVTYSLIAAVVSPYFSMLILLLVLQSAKSNQLPAVMRIWLQS